MSEILSALLVFTLLCASAGLGLFVRPHLPALHREHDTVEMMALVIGMLVTFAALVLGLLTASVKETYDNAAHDRETYSLQLAQLDQCLRNYGPGGDVARADVRSYTAAVIASTWPLEPPPTGVRYPNTSRMPRVGATPALADLMNRIGLEIDSLLPAGPAQTRVQESCFRDYRDVLRARSGVIEDVQARLSGPFYRVLIFWLMVIFASFGLIAPRHSLSVITIALCAVSLSTAIFVIIDLSHPYTGFFSISSATTRAALASMMRPGG
jgi:hypothetical protein